ncbi:unnamed protein product [Sphagnum jensenii]
MPIPAEDVVQPTQPSQGLLIDTVNKAPEQISARAEDDDINCFSLFLPPFPWGESQQTPQSNGHDAVVAVMDPNVVFPPENSTNTEVILPTVVLTPPEPHTKPAPEILDWSSSTQGTSWFVFCQFFSHRLKRVFFPISAGSTLSSKDGLLQGLLEENPDTANTDSPTTDTSISIPDVYQTTSVATTVIHVHGAPPTPEVSKVQEYLKSVVYGGLDVSLISLGVVASAAGGDAKTRTVLAMGLANLIFGTISFFHKVIELHEENPAQFKQTVGQSFLLNGCLAFLSFLVFGSLPTLTFGFSFRQSNNHDYKMLATVVVSVISVMLLGCAKVFAKGQSSSVTKFPLKDPEKSEYHLVLM